MIRIFLPLVLVVQLCFSSLASAKEVRVGGGGAAIIGVFAPAVEMFQNETGIRVLLNINTPVNGLIDLDRGDIDIATAAIPFKDLLDKAAAQGITVDAKSMSYVIVGNNVTKFVVNRSNPLTALTKEQLKDIFSGRIKNWKSVGGSDTEIKVVWGDQTPGQNQLVAREILSPLTVRPEKILVRSYKDIRAKIMDLPGGIGFIPETLVTAQIKVLDPAPVIGESVIAVTKGTPTPAAKQLLDFIKEVSSAL